MKSDVARFEEMSARLKATIGSHEEALAWRAGQVESLEKAKAILLQSLETTAARLGTVANSFEAIQASSGWRFVLRVRNYRESFLRMVRIFKR